MFKSILLLRLKCILCVGGGTKIGLFFFLPQRIEAVYTESHWGVSHGPCLPKKFWVYPKLLQAHWLYSRGSSLSSGCAVCYICLCADNLMQWAWTLRWYSAVSDEENGFVYYKMRVKKWRMCFIISIFNGNFLFLDFMRLPVTTPVE